MPPQVYARCIVGSQLYGLAFDGSDTDWVQITHKPHAIHPGKQPRILSLTLDHFLASLKTRPTLLYDVLYQRSDAFTFITPEFTQILANRERHADRGGFRTEAECFVDRSRKTVSGEWNKKSPLKAAVQLVRLAIVATEFLRPGPYHPHFGEVYPEETAAIRHLREAGDVPGLMAMAEPYLGWCKR